MCLCAWLCASSQPFHDRLKAEQDILEMYDVEESCKYITVRARIERSGTTITRPGDRGQLQEVVCQAASRGSRHCSSAVQLARQL